MLINSNIMTSSQKLQSVFLEQMTQHLMPDMRNGDFSGGVGEQHFASFLNRAYADALSSTVDLRMKADADG